MIACTDFKKVHFLKKVPGLKEYKIRRYMGHYSSTMLEVESLDGGQYQQRVVKEVESFHKARLA